LINKISLCIYIYILNKKKVQKIIHNLIQTDVFRNVSRKINNKILISFSNWWFKFLLANQDVYQVTISILSFYENVFDCVLLVLLWRQWTFSEMWTSIVYVEEWVYLSKALTSKNQSSISWTPDGNYLTYWPNFDYCILKRREYF
jgi:hypothetical protein